MSLKYRPEVDGLRSIAVSSVVLYHAEFLQGERNLFQGGFIGVDIFFVISGYLITLIILGEMGEDRFSFADFYERRARRILPALFTVMLVSIPFAWLYMLPDAMREYAGSLLSALGFTSNIWFWLEDSYWAAPNALKPFLHTWSLSVEEQFYLFFPPVMLILYRYAKDHITGIILAGFFLSLVLAEFTSRNYAVAGFYLLPMRGWELLAGALLARYELERGRVTHSFLNATMPFLGLLMVCYSIFEFSGKTPHPSFITLIPIIGTMLLILFAKKGELITGLLSSRPFVSLGLISYSFYLWHFPVFAFARMAFEEVSSLGKITLIFLSLILSIASYYFVEKPARKKSSLPRRPLVILLTVVGASLIIAFTFIYASGGAKFRLGGVTKHISVDYYHQPENRARFSTQEGCWLGGYIYNENEPFRQCRSKENLSSSNLIVVIGDSNVASLIPGLIDLFGRETIVQRVATGCRPYAEYFQDEKEHKNHHDFCLRSIKDAISDLAELDPKLIILGGLYMQTVEADYFSMLLQNELDAYRDRILIMGPLPRWGNLVRTLVEKYEEDPLHFSVPERLPPKPLTFILEKRFKALAQEQGVGYLSPVETFCEVGQCLVKVSDAVDGITAWDYGHLTHKASSYLIEKNHGLISSYLDEQ
jgi:peptidoglycan/LPS O-acetylase OafA/YrhL